ncbi:MAG TPA: DUF192 domain-containing protein [Actinomycetota bacterium]
MSRALVALLALIATVCGGTRVDLATEDRRPVAIRTDEGTIDLTVLVADDADERRTGLMGRETLEPVDGMAFVYAEPTEGSFWMKDTLIPLSIAFWDDRGRIVEILDMDPCEAEPCPSYGPGVAFVGALELAQGAFEEHGIEVGDRVELAESPS